MSGAYARQEQDASVRQVVDRHRQRIAEHIDSIRQASRGPGISSRVTIEIVVDQAALRQAAEAVLGGPRPPGAATASNEAVADESAEGEVLVGEVIPLIDECFDFLASSHLSAAKAVSEISAIYRSQEELLAALRTLDAIDDRGLAAYSDQLKCAFNATKLGLARHWLDQGRDETDIGKVTRKLYRGVGGAADVATEIADIVETAREWGRLGDHPSTGAPVFVKVGPNGRMYVQLGRRSETTPRRALRIELPDRVEYGTSDPRVVARYTSRQGGDPNDVTLDQALKLIDEKLERQRPWGADPKSGRPIFLRMGPYGHYLQLGRTIPTGGSGSTVRVSVPPHIDPDALTLKEASRLLHRRMEQDRPLGQDPVSGQNVYVKDGRFGPFAQLGERKQNGPRVKIVDLPEGLEPDDVDLERALALLGQFALRNLGPHPDTGAAVTVQTTGRFGPFVSCRKEHATVPERFDPMDVTLDEAVRFLAAKRELMVWRREARADFDKAVSPAGGWYERLGQASEMDLEPAEIGRLLQEKRADYYAGLTEPVRTAMLDRIETVRARQQRPPHEAHARGDISDEALERAIQYLDEWSEEARRTVARHAFSERIE